MILLNFCINVAKWLSATLDELVRILADQQWIARKATCEQNCAGFIHIEMSSKFEKLMFRKRVQEIAWAPGIGHWECYKAFLEQSTESTVFVVDR